jgi:hypothetical protein
MESAPLLEGANTEGSYFAEAEEVVGTIEALTADPPLPAPTGRSLHWVTDVLERYQEQPSLLDPHLEALVGPLMGAVRGRTAEGPSEKMSELMRVVYVLCKVRGYKTIGARAAASRRAPRAPRAPRAHRRAPARRGLGCSPAALPSLIVQSYQSASSRTPSPISSPPSRSCARRASRRRPSSVGMSRTACCSGSRS